MQRYPIDAVGFDSLFLQSGGIYFVSMTLVGPQLRECGRLCSGARWNRGSHQGERRPVLDPDGDDGGSTHR